MTEKENELYLKIKKDQTNFMFGMLFQINENGETIPIKGKTLKLMPDGIPMILNESTAKPLSGSADADHFASVRTNKPPREISIEIALESPFGEKSAFYKKEREIRKGKIPKL